MFRSSCFACLWKSSKNWILHTCYDVQQQKHSHKIQWKTSKQYENKVWGHANNTSVCFSANLHPVDTHFDVWCFQFNALYIFMKEKKGETKYKAVFCVVTCATRIIFQQSVLLFNVFRLGMTFHVYRQKYAYTRTCLFLCDIRFFIASSLTLTHTFSLVLTVFLSY